VLLFTGVALHTGFESPHILVFSAHFRVDCSVDEWLLVRSQRLNDELNSKTNRFDSSNNTDISVDNNNTMKNIGCEYDDNDDNDNSISSGGGRNNRSVALTIQRIGLNGVDNLYNSFGCFAFAWQVRGVYSL